MVTLSVRLLPAPQGWDLVFDNTVDSISVTAMAACWGMPAAIGFLGMAITALGGQQDVHAIAETLKEKKVCLAKDCYVCIMQPVSACCCLLLPAAACCCLLLLPDAATAPLSLQPPAAFRLLQHCCTDKLKQVDLPPQEVFDKAELDIATGVAVPLEELSPETVPFSVSGSRGRERGRAGQSGGGSDCGAAVATAGHVPALGAAGRRGAEREGGQGEEGAGPRRGQGGQAGGQAGGEQRRRGGAPQGQEAPARPPRRGCRGRDHAAGHAPQPAPGHGRLPQHL